MISGSRAHVPHAQTAPSRVEDDRTDPWDPKGAAMSGRIYLLNDAELVAMNEAAYDSEDLLQELLAKHPDLLAGDQINAEDPRRWLLVTREMAVPGEEDGAGRWSPRSPFPRSGRGPHPGRGEAQQRHPVSGARWSGRCSTTPPTR